MDKCSVCGKELEIVDLFYKWGVPFCGDDLPEGYMEELRAEVKKAKERMEED